MATADIKVPSLADRGEEVYDRCIRAIVEPTHNGKVMVIDVDSGDYDMDGGNGCEATTRMRNKHPGKLFYFKRVGSPVMHYFRSPRLVKAHQ